MDSDLPHSRRVARFSVQIHDSLVRFGLLKSADKNSRELLKAAAMVHEVGRFAGEKTITRAPSEWSATWMALWDGRGRKS